MITLKSESELKLMRTSGKVVGQVLVELEKKIKPGVTTLELDKFAYEFFKKNDCVPAFLGYHGYPATICASVNDQVVHGIPDKRVLEEGDIVGIDVGAFYKGYCGDSARTFAVGKVSSELQKLLRVTFEGLNKGIDQCRVGNRISDIGHAVQEYAEAQGYSVVKDYVGHGIGQAMHEEPQVPNYGKPHQGPRLVAGMCLALEPMVNVGGDEVRVLEDGWTVVTKDGKFSAHFEDTIAVLADGPENLTRI
ncbi:MAG TPA: type I methionyl aminopeptidase [bacterium]|nr:type I methionyl aminopeptidase [bacterium]